MEYFAYSGRYCITLALALHACSVIGLIKQKLYISCMYERQLSLCDHDEATEGRGGETGASAAVELVPLVCIRRHKAESGTTTTAAVASH